jgi:transposase
MTHAEAIAAEVAARYGIAVNPAVVQIIPRGVSGLPDPLAPKTREESKRAYTGAWYGAVKAKQRQAKFQRVALREAAAKEPRPVTPPEVLRERAMARKRDARHAASEAIAATITAMAEQPIADIAAAVRLSELAVRRLATKRGIALVEVQKPKAKRTAPEALLIGRSALNERKKAEAAERRARVWALADGKRTRREIAEALGENWHFVKRALSGYAIVCADPAPKPVAAPKAARKLISPDDVQRLLNERLTQRQIADALGFNLSTVTHCVAKHKLSRPEPLPRPIGAPAPRKPSAWQAEHAATRERVRLAAAEIGTIPEIAARVGISRMAAQRHLNALGLCPEGGRKLERDAAIVEDWRNGMAYRHIAEKYGIAKSNVHRIVGRAAGMDKVAADAIAPVAPTPASGVAG